jgi:hypothetical protein
MLYDFGPEQLVIPLSRGKFATIDFAERHLVAGHKWFAIWRRGGSRPNWYVQGYEIGATSKRVLMHRLLANAPSDLKVDHWNGCGLINRRDNLRVCTTADNCANQMSQRKGKYKGVFKVIDEPTYTARISGKNGSVVVGRFATAEEAARCYDDAARIKWGKFACVNFPADGERSAIPDGHFDSGQEPTRTPAALMTARKNIADSVKGGLSIAAVMKEFGVSRSQAQRSCKYFGVRRRPLAHAAAD